MNARFLVAGFVAGALARFAAGGEVAVRSAPIEAIPFVANSGQLDGRVAFAARTRSGAAFVTTDGKIVYRRGGRGSDRARPPHRLSPAKARPNPVSVLTESFVGGSPRPRPGVVGATRVASFLGADPSRWSRRAETYRDVDLGEVYPGVRIRLVARPEGIEKVFIVAPGASLDSVRMAIDGGRDLELEADGSLCATTAAEPLRITAPIAAQVDDDGSSTAVPIAFRAEGLSYGFVAGAYDRQRELIVDPIVQATYLGGEGDDGIQALAIAANGDVVVAGYTYSLDFPVTSGGRPAEDPGRTDGFVARVTADLRTVIEAVYLGGSGYEFVATLALAGDGDVVVAGHTDSRDFPKIAGGAQTTSSDQDGFVARLSGDLQSLRQATYVGGDGVTGINGVALAANGDVIAAGQTSSVDLPDASGGAQEHNASNGQQEVGTEDAFAVRLRGDLKGYIQATFLGGTGDEETSALAIAANGDVVVAGRTQSPSFPGTAEGAQPASGGDTDGFLARLTGDLKSLVGSTYLGGGDDDAAVAVALAGNGDILVCGTTDSRDFPHTSGGAQKDYAAFDDAFVARLTGDLRTVTQATYLGGGGEDEGAAVAMAAGGDVLVAGSSTSDTFPGVSGGAQEEHAAFSDGFVARLGPDLRTIVQSTFVGGDNGDGASALALDAKQNVVIAGSTSSTDLPRAGAGAQPEFAGGEEGGDGFVARLTGDLKAGVVRGPIVPAPSPAPELVGPR